MVYYKNDETGAIGIFTSDPGDGWTELTQEEKDAYLLEVAKNDKRSELNIDLSDFQVAGYEFGGIIVCNAWAAETTYVKYDLVLASDSKNYKSLKDNNLNNEPPDVEWWEEFKPVFKTDDQTIVDLTAKCAMDPGAPDRYKFYCTDCAMGMRHQINFNTSANWNIFAEEIRVEHDRIMGKYNAYRIEIALCATVAAVEAVTIDFEA